MTCSPSVPHGRSRSRTSGASSVAVRRTVFGSTSISLQARRCEKPCSRISRRAAARRAAPQAISVFCQQVLQRSVVQHRLRQQLLQPPVLILQPLQPLRLRWPHARFDRRWTRDGRLLRLPQEDCSQALSVPPSRKYQHDHGPGLVDILDLLKGSDTPAEDQKLVLKAQVLFWLIGATDGHAKNFSIFLRPGGSFSLTPFYDVLSAQPSLDARQIAAKQMKLAMSVGNNNYYRIDRIHARHFVQTGAHAGLPKVLVREAIEEVRAQAEDALAQVEAWPRPPTPQLPAGGSPRRRG